MTKILWSQIKTCKCLGIPFQSFQATWKVSYLRDPIGQQIWEVDKEATSPPRRKGMMSMGLIKFRLTLAVKNPCIMFDTSKILLSLLLT